MGLELSPLHIGKWRASQNLPVVFPSCNHQSHPNAATSSFMFVLIEWLVESSVCLVIGSSFAALGVEEPISARAGAQMHAERMPNIYLV